jgi:hypothetical protein
MGLGFAPNPSAPSPVTCENRDLNVMKTWGGNELEMDDTEKEESTTIATPRKFRLDEGVTEGWEVPPAVDRVKGLISENSKIREAYESFSTAKDMVGADNCELSLDNYNMSAALRAWMLGIALTCDPPMDCSMILSTIRNEIKMDDLKEKITVKTEGGCEIEMNDKKKKITVKTADDGHLIRLDASSAGEHILVHTAKGRSIILDDKKEHMLLMTKDGHLINISDRDGMIKLETADGCKVDIDDKNNAITLINARQTNKIVLDGKGKSLTLESKGDININAGGKINISSKDRMLLKGDKEIDIKGKTRMTISGPASSSICSKKGDTTVKGKKIKLN